MGLPIDLFLHKPDPHLICPICHEVLDNPTSLQCGHHFCRSCLSYQKSTEVIVCPTCGHSENEESKNRRIYRHNTVVGIIENLHIRCRNQFEREQELQLKGNYIECNWKGKLCEYKTHAESTCPFERLVQSRGRTYYSKSEFASPRKYVKAVESEDLESSCKDMLHLTDDDIENGSDKENEDRHQSHQR